MKSPLMRKGKSELQLRKQTALQAQEAVHVISVPVSMNLRSQAVAILEIPIVYVKWCFVCVHVCMRSVLFQVVTSDNSFCTS